jgi:hypothetical protein
VRLPLTKTVRSIVQRLLSFFWGSERLELCCWITVARGDCADACPLGNLPPSEGDASGKRAHALRGRFVGRGRTETYGKFDNRIVRRDPASAAGTRLRLGASAVLGTERMRAPGARPRMVKKLMRPLARSILGAPPAVRDTEWGLDTFCLGWTKERAARCLCLDDSSRDDNVPHTR